MDKRQITGLLVARYFKFYAQDTNDYIEQKLLITQVPCKSFYQKNKQIFDKLAFIFNKYNIDLHQYIKFFLFKRGISQYDVQALIKPSTFQCFANYIFVQKKHKKVFEYFNKSVDFIVSECKKQNFSSATDYFLHIIKERKLSYYVLSGKISLYFLATIPNFVKIIEKMDPISQNEFQIFKNRFDIYSNAAVSAYKHFKNIQPNPFKILNEKIYEKNS